MGQVVPKKFARILSVSLRPHLSVSLRPQTSRTTLKPHLSVSLRPQTSRSNQFSGDSCSVVAYTFSLTAFSFHFPLSLSLSPLVYARTLALFLPPPLPFSFSLVPEFSPFRLFCSTRPFNLTLALAFILVSNESVN